MAHKTFSLTAERTRRDNKTFITEMKQNVVDGYLDLREVANWFGQPVGQVKQRLRAVCEEYGAENIFRVIGVEDETCIGYETKKKGRKKGAESKKDGGLSDLIAALEV